MEPYQSLEDYIKMSKDEWASFVMRKQLEKIQKKRKEAKALAEAEAVEEDGEEDNKDEGKRKKDLRKRKDNKD